MTRFWTCHWQFRYWRDHINAEFEPVDGSGSNNFRKRGVSTGDTVYVVSLSKGQLYLGGRMTVKQIMSRPQAVRLWDNDNLFEAEEWIVDPDQTGTLLHLHRCLAPSVTKQLRFKSKAGPKEPYFVSDTELDNQATRGVRELTRESAELLDRIIELTDRLPRSDDLLIVTDDLLRDGTTPLSRQNFRLPDEVPAGTVFHEGKVQRIEVNRYERDAKARMECITVHGSACCICGFRFRMMYGSEAEGYNHVHHARPLSEISGDYKVDPIKDLEPVCPNCHAMLHLGGRCRTSDEVRQMIAQQKQA